MLESGWTGTGDSLDLTAGVFPATVEADVTAIEVISDFLKNRRRLRFFDILDPYQSGFSNSRSLEIHRLCTPIQHILTIGCLRFLPKIQPSHLPICPDLLTLPTVVAVKLGLPHQPSTFIVGSIDYQGHRPVKISWTGPASHESQCARTNDAYLGLLSAFARFSASCRKCSSLLILSQFPQNLETVTS